MRSALAYHWLSRARTAFGFGIDDMRTCAIYVLMFYSCWLHLLSNSANRDKHMQDDNDEIVLIPDLDEDGGADSDQRSKSSAIILSLNWRC